MMNLLSQLTLSCYGTPPIGFWHHPKLLSLGFNKTFPGSIPVVFDFWVYSLLHVVNKDLERDSS